jgi:succinylglutamate desuccinylase
MRFLESDLNRSFLIDHPKNPEQQRALEISKIARNAKFVIDLHQTIEATETPFFILEKRDDLIQLSHNLAGDLPIVAFPSMGFSHSGKTVIEFVSSVGGLGIGMEWGQRGFSNELAQRSLQFLESVISRINSQGVGGIQELTTKSNSTPFEYYYLKDYVPNKGQTILEPGFNNFTKFSKGEVLARDGAEAFLAPYDGCVFFPKYGELAQKSTELCELGKTEIFSPH